MKRTLLILLLCFSFSHLFGSHLIGGHISYEHLSGSTYRFTLTQYRDCRPPSLGGGNLAALMSDGPFYISYFFDNGNFWVSDSITPSQAGGILVENVTPNVACTNNLPPICINKITATFTKTFPNNSNGFYVVNQRCCYKDGIENLNVSGKIGQTLMTFVPAIINNTAPKFKEDNGKVLCLHQLQTLDFSATDANADSLSYALCFLQQGGSTNDPKPIQTSAPPYPPMAYKADYIYDRPFGITTNTTFNLNPTTGLFTITPSLIGNYYLGICCTEWRNGIAINTNERHMVLTIIDCQVGLDIDVSLDQITPFNCPVKLWAQGADNYQWEIKSPLPSNQNIISLDDYAIANPTVIYNQGSPIRHGEYTLLVKGTLNNGCVGFDSLKLIVTDDAYFFVPNAFSPNGDGLNDYFTITNSGHEFEYIRIFNRWGTKVFESNSLNMKWDGRYKGNDASADSYFWVARTRDKQGNRITHKGTVTIVR